MGDPLIQSLLISLVLSLVLELLMALLWGVRGWRDILLVALVNFMTNPPVVLTHNLIRLETPLAFTLALEAAVVALEGLCYKLSGRTIKRPFLFSLSANAFSYLTGLLLLKFIYGG